MAIYTLLSRSVRSGSFVTPSVTVPIDAVGRWTLRTNMLENDLSQIGFDGYLAVEISIDGGNLFDTWMEINWESGFISYPRISIHNPCIGGLIAGLAGYAIRAQVILAKSTRIGFVLEIQT